MACSNCGNLNCFGCAQNVTNSNVVLTPVQSGVRPCSPLANCGSSSSGCTSTLPASPAPFYECTPQCAEDHCQQIYLAQFQTAICTTYAFNMPACGATANLYFADLKVLPVGSYLWAPSVGYLRVVAFNHQTGLVTVVNQCQTDNASVGTSIPACTCFVITPPPADVTNPTFFPFVAIDFTAPAVSSCIDITVTTIAGLVVGSTVAIGSGFYQLDAIVSPTVITICNTGDGILPGTSVLAKNGAGEFQYPIITASLVGLPHRLFNNTTQVSSVGAGPTALASYTLPGGTSVNNGDTLYGTFFSTTAANANAKTIDFTFGGLTLISLVVPAVGAEVFVYITIIVKDAATIQTLAEVVVDALPNSAKFFASRALNMTVNQTLLITGSGVANGDIVKESFLVDSVPGI